MNISSKVKGIYNNFKNVFNTNNTDAIVREKTPTIKEVAYSTNKDKKKNMNVIVKALSYMTNAGTIRSNNFYPCDYDINLLKEAINTDSYLKVAVQKNMQLFFKAGYTLRSSNDKASKYVEQRFRIMNHCTRQSCDILWKEVASDLECYSNAFLIKTRVQNIPFINARGITNSGKPVGGYFRVDPATMSVKYDDNGYITKYKQKIGRGKEKEFSVDDVIHFTYDREAGSIWGVPRMIAALEDVKLLRMVEGNIVSMIYRFAMPLVHLKIGLPTTGMGGTMKEVEDAKREVESSPMDGIYVSTERTEFKTIGVEGEAVDAKPYMEYFENRVFSVLNMSQAMMGRGGSKQDADSMEEQAHNKIKNDQALFSAQIEAYIINELLLEGGFNPITNDDDVVKFVFNEINTDTKVKLENHEMTKYVSNLITFEEARHNIGMKSDDVDESRLYQNMVVQTNAIEQLEIQNDAAIELANINNQAAEKLAKMSSGDSSTNSSTTPSSSSSGYTKKNTGNGKGKGSSSTGQRTVQAKNNPSNQYGTYSPKIKESFNREDASVREKITLLCNKYNALRNGLLEHSDKADSLLLVYRNEFYDIINSAIKEQSYKGSKEALTAMNISTELTGYSYTSNALDLYVKNTIEKLMTDIKEKIENSDDVIFKESAINSMQYRVSHLCDFAMNKAYWYAYLKTALQCGAREAIINSGENGSHSAMNEKRIDITNFKLDDIPGYSSNCTCTLSIPETKDADLKER